MEGVYRPNDYREISVSLVTGVRGLDLTDLTRDRLQKFLDAKARSGLSKSVVAHLRWDLNAIFKMAADDAIIQGNPAGSLVVPREARITGGKRNMTEDEILLALSVLDLRERIIFRLALLVGMRPGEIVALRWGRVN